MPSPRRASTRRNPPRAPRTAKIPPSFAALLGRQGASTDPSGRAPPSPHAKVIPIRREVWCTEHEVIFDPRTGLHSQCQVQPLPTPRARLASVLSTQSLGPHKTLYTTGFPGLDRVMGEQIATRDGKPDEYRYGLSSGQVVMLAGKAGQGKCLEKSALVFNPDTGQRERIDVLVARGAPFPVLSLDTETMRLVRAEVSAVHANGVRPVFTITTRNGRTLCATANHPLLTPAGWRKLDALSVGDELAVPAVVTWRAVAIAAVGGEMTEIDWDEVVSVVASGEAEVFDLTVPDHHNFIANDLIVHNSTLLGSICANMARIHKMRVLYVSGEETAQQLQARLFRTEAQHTGFRLMHTEYAGDLATELEGFNPHLVVVDSAQTITLERGMSSTAQQVERLTNLLTEYAKQSGTILLIVNQLNADDSLAGPQKAKHKVDTLLRLALEHSWTHVRSLKNRFGPVNESATFEMTARGLVEVEDPGERLTLALLGQPGVVAFPAALLARPVLLPIEATVGVVGQGAGRDAMGISLKRLRFILNLVRTHIDPSIAKRDVVAKVPVFAGVNMEDPTLCDGAVDLALLVSILSALKGIIPPPVAFYGELSLTGVVTPATRGAAREDTARKAGLSAGCASTAAQPADGAHRGDGIERQAGPALLAPRFRHVRDVLPWLVAHGQQTALPEPPEADLDAEPKRATKAPRPEAPLALPAPKKRKPAAKSPTQRGQARRTNPRNG